MPFELCAVFSPGLNNIVIFYKLFSALQSYLLNDCGLLDITISKLKGYNCASELQILHDCCENGAVGSSTSAKLDYFDLKHTSLLGNILIIAQVYECLSSELLVSLR